MIKKCPQCLKEFESSNQNKKLGPFCSERCQQIDLGAWLSGVYSIPCEPTQEERQEESEMEIPQIQEE